MKKILISGINGFLGSHLARYLSSDYEIVGLEATDHFLSRINGMNLRVYFTDKDDLSTIFRDNNFFAVLHTATLYSTQTHQLSDLIRTNVILPLNLYEYANKNACQLFINTDSFFNDARYYGYNYLPEYTLTKRQILEWLKIIRAETTVINMKIHHMYGENDNNGKFVQQMLEKMLRNQPEIDLTSGEQKRDFIYIKDVCSAYGSVLESEHHVNDKIIEFEVGTGVSISIKDFILEIKQRLDSKSGLRFGKIPYRENEIMNAVCDNRKLLELGWRPQYDYRSGITQLVSETSQVE